MGRSQMETPRARTRTGTWERRLGPMAVALVTGSEHDVPHRLDAIVAHLTAMHEEPEWITAVVAARTDLLTLRADAAWHRAVHVAAEVLIELNTVMTWRAAAEAQLAALRTLHARPLIGRPAARKASAA